MPSVAAPPPAPVAPYAPPKPVGGGGALRAKRPAPPRCAAGARVLAGLLRENGRFVRGEGKRFGGVAAARRRLSAEGQRPLAAVVACADSRVAPELLFRAGLGELFVVRAAGNTAWGDEVLGSLEYAVDHLGVAVVMVLGHTQCGAVAAAVAGGDPPPGALGKHVVAIAKALDERGGRCDDRAVARNVEAAVDFLRADPAGAVAAAERAGRVAVVGAVYDIRSGAVAVLDACEPPQPARRVAPLRAAARVVRWACAAAPSAVAVTFALWHVARVLGRSARADAARVLRE